MYRHRNIGVEEAATEPDLGCRYACHRQDIGIDEATEETTEETTISNARRQFHTLYVTRDVAHLIKCIMHAQIEN
jgi:hypothetical protein